MDKNSGALRGVIPILATPFAEDESLDLESWRRLIEFMAPSAIAPIAQHVLVERGRGGCCGGK